MKVAVVGGGINGIITAWELLKKGHSVTLFEKGEVMQQNQKFISVFGGKWPTARQLGQEISGKI